MAPSLRDISLRHLPDLSDASFSFSFQIPTDATAADDLLRVDGGDDFLHAAAGDDSRVDEPRLIPAATSSPPKLLPTTRSNMNMSSASRVPKSVATRSKGALVENDDIDATRTVSAPVKATAIGETRTAVSEEAGRVEDKTRTKASKPAFPMKHTRSNSAVSTNSTNPPSKPKPKSTASKSAIPTPPTDGGMVARLLMYGSGMHMDVDTTMDAHLPPNTSEEATDADVGLADALREAAEEPIFSDKDDRATRFKSQALASPAHPSPATPHDEPGARASSPSDVYDAGPSSASVAAQGPLTLSQLSPQKDKPTSFPAKPELGLPLAPPSPPAPAPWTRVGSQDESKSKGKTEKPTSKAGSKRAGGKSKPESRTKTRMNPAVDGDSAEVALVAEGGEVSESGAPNTEAPEREPEEAVMLPFAPAAPIAVDLAEERQRDEPEDEGPLTLSQLSPRKQLPDSLAKLDGARVPAPAPAAAPTITNPARNVNVDKDKVKGKGKKPVPVQAVSKRDVQIKAKSKEPVHGQPVSKRDVQIRAKSVVVNEKREAKDKMEVAVAESAETSSVDAETVERAELESQDAIDDESDKDVPLTVSQLSPRKIDLERPVPDADADPEEESNVGVEHEHEQAAVRAPSPMRPAAKHPRPVSVASHGGAIKKSRVGVSGAARGPSAALSRGRGRGRVVSAPPRQAASVGSRSRSESKKSATAAAGARKVSQPTASSSRWSQTQTSTRSQGDMRRTRSTSGGGSGSVASSSSGSKHTVVSATAMGSVSGEDAPTDGSKSKGYTIPDFKAMHASLALRRSQAVVPVVTPTPFSFSTDMRVKDRQAFDAQVKAREEERERERERERREREAKEEEEVREMRRRAVPKAHEVPEWYKEAPKTKRAREE